VRNLLITCGFVALIGLGGCSSSPPDDSSIKPGSGVALNPSGKPRTPQESAYASQMQQVGNQINAARMRDAAAMKAAQERTGGK
jgi:hypothetical protein